MWLHDSRLGHSPAMRLTNLPSGLQIASTRRSSSGVKSGPALTRLVPLRLICMTPTTFSADKIGALMIFWIDSPVAVFTPSNTAACRTAEKLLLISGRRSRAVRAASAELLVSGMNPTFFSTCGTRKYRCLRLPFRRIPERRRAVPVLTPNLYSCVLCYLLSRKANRGPARRASVNRDVGMFAALRSCGKNFSNCLCRSKRHVSLHRSC